MNHDTLSKLMTVEEMTVILDEDIKRLRDAGDRNPRKNVARLLATKGLALVTHDPKGYDSLADRYLSHDNAELTQDVPYVRPRDAHERPFKD